MKSSNFNKSRFFFFSILFTVLNINAQVNLTATSGTLTQSYTTLKGAFDAINLGTHGGVIAISLSGNTTETASAILNSGQVSPAVFTSVSITATIPVTISGLISGAVIKLNGADNVTIDGRINGVGRNISVINTNGTANTAAIWMASVVTGNGCTNNTIRNLEIACGANQNITTVTTFGIIMCGTTISTTANGVDNDNNLISNNRIIKSRYGIVTRGTTTNPNQNIVISDNIVGPSAFGDDQIGKAGILMQADNPATVTGNTVQFVGGFLANTTGGTDRVGIGIGTDNWIITNPNTLTSANYTVTKNIIHDIIEERTNSAVGLIVATTNGGSPTNNLIANNMIYNIRSNSTTSDQLIGLAIAAGHSDIIANNSISLIGDVDPSAGATSAQSFGSGIRINSASSANHANLTLINNCVYIDLSGNSSTTRYYAISGNTAAYSFGTGRENYNNYYINPLNSQLRIGGLGSTAGPSATTEFATLANWKTAYTTPQDANSIQADPLYLSNLSDLHLLNNTSPNINAGTSIAAVTDDFDSQVRPNGLAYDIGIDEFFALPGTFQFSASTYSSNEGTSLTVTVNRGGSSSGVATVNYSLSNITAIGGSLCNVGIDFINAGMQTLTFADGVASMSFNLSLCSDTIVDLNETFTVSLSSPTGGTTLGTNTTATITILDVALAFNGIYTVGTGGTYASLTNAGGIFAAINSSGVTGAITINIVSDLLNETGANALNENSGGFSIKIQPFGGSRIISGNNSGALIRLNGADYITIDGSTTNASVITVCDLIGGNASFRELTIQNTNTATTAAVVSIQTGNNGARYNVIKNVNIIGQNSLTTLAGISIGGNTPGTAGIDNDNNQIINCSIKKAIYGIYSSGENSNNSNVGNTIKNNDIIASGLDKVSRFGIAIFNETFCDIVGNSIGGMQSGQATDVIGIALGTLAISTSSIATGGGITNTLISRNKIHGIESVNVEGYSAAGIAINGGILGSNTISSNMISGIISPAATPDLVAGIYINAVSGASTEIFNNTISLTGTRTHDFISQNPSYGIAITGENPNVLLRNNIFINKLVTSALDVNAKSYSIGLASTTFGNFNSDYNVFWSSGANNGGFRTGSLEVGLGVNYATLALWSSAVGNNVSSLAVDPVFVAPSDLHLNVFANNAIDNKGTYYLPFALNDIDCEHRNSATPDIGADEMATCTSFGGTVSALVSSFCQPDETTISATGYSTDGSFAYQWQSSSDGAFTNPINVGGATTEYEDLLTGVISTTTYYRLAVTCIGSSLISYSDNVAQVIIDSVSITASASTYVICGNSGQSVTLTADGAGPGGTYSWSPANAIIGSGASVTVKPTQTTNYVVTGTNANGCSNVFVITIIYKEFTATAGAVPERVCNGLNSQLSIETTGGEIDLTQYTFIGSTGVYVPISSGTLSTAVGDDGSQNSIQIGFPFKYNGISFTTFSISTNGFIKLGGDVPSISYENDLDSSTNTIGALWDDNNQSTGTISYKTTGTAPNRILTVEWKNVSIGGNGSTANASNSFQIQLNESTSSVKFLYNGLTASNGITATIGLSGNLYQNLSVTPSSPVSSSTVSSLIVNNLITSVNNIPTGTVYTFTPPANVFTYSWSPSTFILGQENLPNPVPTNVTSTINYTATVTTSTGCVATAVASVITRTSTVTPVSTTISCSDAPVLLVASNYQSIPTNSNYCIPTVSNNGATNDFINNFSFANITNNGSGDAPSDYTFYNTLTANVVVGSSYTLTLKSGSTSVLPHFAAWIDYNHNSVFDSSEYVYATVSPSSPSVGITASILIPNTAISGLTRMRVATRWLGAFNSSMSCINSGFGEYEDYNVNISENLTTTWTSTNGGLFTDALGTISYTGQNSSTVYAKPNMTATITAVSSGNGCSSSVNSVLNVLAGPILYADADNDGFGDSENTTTVCNQMGYVSNNSDCNDGFFSVSNNCPDTVLNLKLFIEGYYEGNNLMRSVKYNQDGFSPTIDVEDVTVALHKTTAPYEMIATTIATLKTNGELTCSFPAAPHGSFYIVVVTRNAIKTFSNLPQTVGINPLNYDFTDASSKAYGNNMKEVAGGVWAFYSGDFNQDEVVDISDSDQLFLDIESSNFGVLATDLNGDGSVDTSDTDIFILNIENSVFANYP